MRNTAGIHPHHEWWIGNSINDFIASTGYTPAQILPDDRGGQMYLFNVGRTLMPTTNASVYGSSTYATGMATTYGGSVIPIEQSCVWSLRVDAANRIRSWSA
jgi:hypothetical protein